MNTGAKVSTHYGALDAFFPAVLALSGDLERAEQLQESSYKMWTTCGIEPEEFDYSTMKITYPGYELRPGDHRVDVLPVLSSPASRCISTWARPSPTAWRNTAATTWLRRAGQCRDQAEARRYGELFPGGNSEVPVPVVCSEVDARPAQGGV